uniref:Uncharacterized protein n=1 Tax=Morchella importuna TaxID=1174673 RepID=A0A650AFA1_9PEZI|nr:hypothetical protein [Morchella importuna]QGN66667.1 hypothetical protein [Morchella importuna]
MKKEGPFIFWNFFVKKKSKRKGLLFWIFLLKKIKKKRRDMGPSWAGPLLYVYFPAKQGNKWERRGSFGSIKKKRGAPLFIGGAPRRGAPPPPRWKGRRPLIFPPLSPPHPPGPLQPYYVSSRLEGGGNSGESLLLMRRGGKGKTFYTKFLPSARSYLVCAHACSIPSLLLDCKRDQLKVLHPFIQPSQPVFYHTYIVKLSRLTT